MLKYVNIDIHVSRLKRLQHGEDAEAIESGQAPQSATLRDAEAKNLLISHGVLPTAREVERSKGKYHCYRCQRPMLAVGYEFRCSDKQCGRTGWVQNVKYTWTPFAGHEGYGFCWLHEDSMYAGTTDVKLSSCTCSAEGDRFFRTTGSTRRIHAGADYF